jgi:flagellar hook protein FlgE
LLKFVKKFLIIGDYSVNSRFLIAFCNYSSYINYMIGAMYSAVSSLMASSSKMDIAGNNIANANSLGYKSKSAFLSSSSPYGSQLQGTRTDFSQGALSRTDNPSDLALNGNGFFVVEDSNGQKSYTRDGGFLQDKDGYLRTADGKYLTDGSSRVQIPANSSNFSVDRNGTVTSFDAAGNATNVANLQIATFSGQESLSSSGGGYYQVNAESGSPTLSTPGQNGAGTIMSGALEVSNVDYVSEIVDMNLTKASFEANIKTIQAADDMLKSLYQMMDKR